jgi:hypothetical protein
VGCFTPRPHYSPGKGPLVPIVHEARWAPQRIWTMWKGQTSCTYLDSNSNLSAAQPIASHYIDCAISTLEALCYNPEGVGFDFRLSLGFSVDLILPAALWALRSTQPRTRIFQEGKERPARKADNLDAICSPTAQTM